MPIEDLVKVIESLKEKIKKYQSELSQSEALTRYTLIDPLLRALGWSTDDPEQVRPEFSTEVGRPDYALLVGGKPHIFVGAKSLGKAEDLNKLATYSVNQGVPYFVSTDGSRWEIYDTFKPVPLAEKKIGGWDLLGMGAGEIARQALALWKPTAIVQPVPAPPPLIQAMLSSTVSPKQTLKPTKGHLLRDLRVVTGQKPTFSRIVFPDGQEYPIKRWNDLLKQTVTWLYETGRLTEDRCPIGMGRKRNLVHTQPKHKDGSGFFQPAQVGPLWVETHYSAKGCKSQAIRLLEELGVNLDEVQVG